MSVDWGLEWNIVHVWYIATTTRCVCVRGCACVCMCVHICVCMCVYVRVYECMSVCDVPPLTVCDVPPLTVCLQSPPLSSSPPPLSSSHILPQITTYAGTLNVWDAMYWVPAPPHATPHVPPTCPHLHMLLPPPVSNATLSLY